ncbi:DHH family phosphoesterase [Heyndrickxia acidicola]|uniref:DHHA1 domain-containing protein n=1 Tax=Heyndrickxia acidicola TaxID=209389 RepID=A0ABU6MKT9_9BACI|nr:DHH family phosphoesterase [Heyndrickxia acidicola]MED1205012.1 DHHA1 domain-containing protein [Heyndrickxia acidicola]
MYTLFTHNDLDGIGCGILAKLAFGEQIHVYYCSISNLNSRVEMFLEQENQENTLIVTDLSVSEKNEEKISAFVQAGGNAVLIDHHKTAEHLNRHDWAHVQTQEEEGKLASATSLFLHYLKEKHNIHFTSALFQFVELVRLYDTWEWEKNQNLEAKRLNDLFYMFSIEEFEEKMLNKLRMQGEFCFDELETKLLDIEENRVERYIRGKKREVYQALIHNYNAGVVHAESYHSELGNELSKEFPHLDYIAIIMAGRKKISFRTIHDHVDVSEIAGEYGGGGHKKASGCQLTPEAFVSFVDKTFHSEPLRQDAHKNRFNIKENESGSLYSNPSGESFFIFYQEEKGWGIEKKHKEISWYTSFYEAEKDIKLHHAAFLVTDDKFVSYLLGIKAKIGIHE